MLHGYIGRSASQAPKLLAASCSDTLAYWGQLAVGLRPRVVSPILPLRSLATLDRYPCFARGQMGGVGGRGLWPRLPPQLHSEIRFLAEGPLKGPGST